MDSAKTALPTLVSMQRRMSVTIREYKFFRSFSQKFENWPKRKAEALWRKMRERKIAGERDEHRERVVFKNFSTKLLNFNFPSSILNFQILNFFFEACKQTINTLCLWRCAWTRATSCLLFFHTSLVWSGGGDGMGGCVLAAGWLYYFWQPLCLFSATITAGYMHNSNTNYWNILIERKCRQQVAIYQQNRVPAPLVATLADRLRRFSSSAKWNCVASQVRHFIKMYKKRGENGLHVAINRKKLLYN